MTEQERKVPEDVLAKAGALGREISTMTVLVHSRIAEHMGLSGTDHKCLELAVQAQEPLTAGQIAQLSGLSTGAVTGVIDRLERAGYVRRVRDPHDRRKVLVEVTPQNSEKFAHLFEGALETVETVLSQFTPEERDLLERYNKLTIDVFRARMFN